MVAQVMSEPTGPQIACPTCDGRGYVRTYSQASFVRNEIGLYPLGWQLARDSERLKQWEANAPGEAALRIQVDFLRFLCDKALTAATCYMNIHEGEIYNGPNCGGCTACNLRAELTSALG